MLFEYLTGWTGGPPLFVNRRGAPMLRARHLPSRSVAGNGMHGCIVSARHGMKLSKMMN